MNNVDVRSLETLRENFDFEKVAAYFLSGKLLEWLESRYYNEEAEKIRNLNKDDKNFGKKLCAALGVDYQGNTEIDLEETAILNEKSAKLKQLTADAEIISHAAQVAFSQEDLIYLLEKGKSIIYLYGDQFLIPARFENRKYIGILGTPKIKIDVKTFEDVKTKGITFENVNLLEKLLHSTSKTESATKKIIQGYAIIKDKTSDGYDAEFICGTIALNSEVTVLRDGKEICSGVIKHLDGRGTNYKNLNYFDETICNSGSYSETNFGIKFNNFFTKDNSEKNLHIKFEFNKFFMKDDSLKSGDIIESYAYSIENEPLPKDELVWTKRPLGLARFLQSGSDGYMIFERIFGIIKHKSKIRVIRKGMAIFTGNVDEAYTYENDSYSEIRVPIMPAMNTSPILATMAIFAADNVNDKGILLGKYKNDSYGKKI